MNVFDILGPVMIGPSSSHTAGAARLGRIANALLGQPAVFADILLHGSFAKTYKGHGTDKALVAGILGMATDDERIRFSLEEAKKSGLSLSISTGEIDGAHPNTARITLTGQDGKTISLRGSSIGGGNIQVTSVNDMDVSFTGERTAFLVLHRDTPGTIAAVTELLAEYDMNICNFRLSRKERGGQAVMTIEVDGSPAEEIKEKIQRLPNIYTCTVLWAQS
ncbi:MAG: L-serine ammonia-lyase, iron-sulfur-dependent subunit beta [Eubacteriales bacterium]|nr:L-serine ammonia-lyase, iron-sulfur-dependent subunit beta [Eubacteriales bacterium]